METTNWRPSKSSVPPPRGLHRFGVRFATLGALSLFACSSSSGPNWPSGAFLFTNPSSFTYVADGGGSVVPSLAAYLTTTQSFAIEIQDHGSDPLTIDKVTLDDPQHGFALVPPSP